MPLFLSKLPIEILLDKICFLLAADDILRLGCTSKFFARLCNDQTLWRRKALEKFRGLQSASLSDWKFIYQNLDKPKGNVSETENLSILIRERLTRTVYLWGDGRNGRLPSINGDVVVPTLTRQPGLRVAGLVAGGWSYYALDPEGNIHVWGTLNGEGYITAQKVVNIPSRLSMPVTFRSISCGRTHTSALDVNNKIWTFVYWDRPFRLTCTLFEDKAFSPIQVECGWMFSCALVKSGDVFVWFPCSGSLASRVRGWDGMNGDGLFVHEEDRSIRCFPWDVDVIPHRLPPLPPLPDFEEQSAQGDAAGQSTKLVKIAGFHCQLVGLTNKGHVLKFIGLENEHLVVQGRWVYLPKFSEARILREHAIFSDPGVGAVAPLSMRITHIAGNFRTFAAYSNSILLMGDTSTTTALEPKILPQLVNKNLISVALGDYHCVALTAEGKVYTWGKFTRGALGLGDRTEIFPLETSHMNPDFLSIDVPTEVRFDHGEKERKERFCIAVAACGWHTGALVIDLERRDEEETGEVEVHHNPRQRQSLFSRIVRSGLLNRNNRN